MPHPPGPAATPPPHTPASNPPDPRAWRVRTGLELCRSPRLCRFSNMAVHSLLSRLDARNSRRLGHPFGRIAVGARGSIPRGGAPAEPPREGFRRSRSTSSTASRCAHAIDPPPLSRAPEAREPLTPPLISTPHTIPCSLRLRRALAGSARSAKVEIEVEFGRRDGERPTSASSRCGPGAPLAPLTAAAVGPGPGASIGAAAAAGGQAGRHARRVRRVGERGVRDGLPSPHRHRPQAPAKRRRRRQR